MATKGEQVQILYSLSFASIVFLLHNILFLYDIFLSLKPYIVIYKTLVVCDFYWVSIN